ncbi:antibiotic biosynthesis monooxygenase [Trichothermofontia sp.]
MNNEHLPSPASPITLVISELVQPSQIRNYEAWAAGINQAVQQFEGFLGVDVIRPREHDYPEYVIILKFDNYHHLRIWLTSASYREWIAKSEPFIIRRSRQQLPSGVEVWFNLPADRASTSSQPAYYKKVILGVLSVYPLILLANWLLGPILQGFPPLLGLLISVTFVSALLTYPVMPWLTQLLSFWLYPLPRK